MFDRCERELEELMDDVECIGDISPDVDAQGQWQRAAKRSTIASYQFPPHETKLREGAAVLQAPSLQHSGTTLSLASEPGTAAIRRGTAGQGEWHVEGAFIPRPPVATWR